MSRMPSTRRMLSPPGGMRNSRPLISKPSGGMTMLTRSRAPSTTAGDPPVHDGGAPPLRVHAFERRPRAAVARHRPAVERVVDDLLNAGRVQDRDHHIDEMEFGLVRRGGGFRRVVVADQGTPAAVLRGAGEIGMAEDVAGAIDARPLAVPHAEYAVVLALAPQLRLLRAPDGGRGKVLVQAGLEQDVARRGAGLRAHELLIGRAERRAAIARDVACGV